ncbi:hypothetical protein CJF42_25520 [Pseudoalteromonas sp. NBT06-2]|uniref:hypothetical protein n=1 Tax=Pseudoalteromonas sp. NBT06-2 TaxID=2025950 RepID=UPI000BA61BE4|nr:hypothetical protein [Pseudoalteromonas sp. NBT06-2]PAJ71663.1 hypothetical protein CJF42_25520 [Pseudoalteromonas sp. NBT06-2]
MSRLIIIFTLVLFSSVVNASTSIAVTGTIQAMRTQTTHHETLASHGEVIIQLSAPLQDGCNWLSVEKDNTSAISFLLSAKAQNQIITAWYYSDKKSKAWGSACQLINIELK